MKSKAAQALGRMAAGKPKNFSAAERKRRSQRMKALNAERSARAAGAGVGPKPSPAEKETNDLS